MSRQNIGILRWSKSEVANILGVTYQELNKHLPETLKKELNWQKGIQYFRDTEAFTIIKYFRGLLTDEEIKKMLYPRGI